MSHFLARLVERQWGRIPTVQPRMPSIFAPVSDAPSVQVVDAAPLRPDAGGEQEPSTGHPEPEAKSPHSNPEQRQSQEPSVSPSTPVVHRAIAPPVVRPLLEPATSAEATVHVERQTPASPPEVPPMPIRPVSDVSVAVQPAPRQGPAAKAKDTVDVHSFAEATPIAAPPLVWPRAQDPTSARQQIFAPASLLVAAPAIDRSPHAEPRAAEAPVHVTIGRIEVTAVTAPPAPKRVASSRKTSMPLQDYLARRRGSQP